MRIPSRTASGTILVLLILLLSSLRAAAFGSTTSEHLYGRINPLIGDRSFFERFGYFPTALTDERLRITTHLAYVEATLRARNVDGMPHELRAERMRNLDRLREYWMRGIYPRNLDRPEDRRPCFIDNDGTICAVGYLVEKSAGRDAAEKINSSFQYATIGEMRSPELDAWLPRSGLTRQEAAMIQPAYAPPRSELRVGVAVAGTATIHQSFTPTTLGGGVASHLSGGLGVGYHLQGTFEKYLGTGRYAPSLLVRGGYEERQSEFEGAGIGAYASVPDGRELIAPTYYRASTRYRRLTADFLFSGGDPKGLRYTFGMGLGFPMEGKRRETLTIDAADPELRFVAMPGVGYSEDGRTAIIRDDRIDDRSPVTIALKAGLRVLPMQILGLIVTPSIWYEHGITTLTRNDPWRGHALGLGLDLQAAIWY